MTERKNEIAINLLKLGFTSRQIVKEFKLNFGEVTDEEKEEIKALARSKGSR